MKRITTQNGCSLRKQKVNITDTGGSIKLVLLLNLCYGKIMLISSKETKLTNFQDMRLKVSKMEQYLNTPKSEKCHFEETTPFLGDLVVVDHHVANLSESVISGEIVGIQSISRNLSRVLCSRKVTAKSETIGNCESCKLTQKIGSCGTQWHLRVVVQNVKLKTEKLKLVMFNQAVQKLATLLGKSVDLSSISEEDLVFFILESEKVFDIGYNVDNKIIDIDCQEKETSV